MKTLADRVSAFINAEGHLTQIDASNENVTGIRFSSRGLKYTAWSMYDDDTALQVLRDCGVNLGVLARTSVFFGRPT